MLSSKKLHRLGVAKPKPMTAMSTQPMLLKHAAVQPNQETNNSEQQQSRDPPPLHMAVIAAQKTTIGGLQLDLLEARAKIEKLQGQCAAAAVIVAKVAECERIQAECKAGYEAGVQHGINKVCLFRKLILPLIICRLWGFGKEL